MRDLIERLRVDAGRTTLGELIQQRVAAANEIERLRREVMLLRPTHSANQRLPHRVARDSGDLLRIDLDKRALLRLKEVCDLVGLSRSTIYNLMADGRFPRSVQVSVRAVRWRSSDVMAWLEVRHHSESR